MLFLLIGGDSEIGNATLTELLLRDQRVTVTTRRREHNMTAIWRFLDLTAPPESFDLPIDHGGVACIFAAVTRLDACHADPLSSEAVNVLRTCELIDLLLARGFYILFLSTNLVFDGTQPQSPALAIRRPQSEYGRQKAAVEDHLATLDAKAAVGILRLGKVIAPRMKRLIDWYVALSKGESVEAFNDMVIAPVPLDQTVSLIIRLMENRESGIWQFTGSEDISYLDIAKFIANRVGASNDLVHEISGKTRVIAPGAFPIYTTLDSSKVAERFGIISPAPFQIINAALPK